VSFAAFFSPSFALFLFMMIHEGNVITTTTDVFIPFSSATQDWLAFYSPWHGTLFGSFSTAPNGYLYAFLLQSASGSVTFTQHTLSLLPIPIAFISSYLMLYSFKKSMFISLAISNLYIFNPVFLSQVTGATGLLYIYAFAPLVIYFSYRLLQHSQNRVLVVKNILGCSLSLFFATFFSTETILFFSLILLPLLLTSLLKYLLQISASRETIRFFAIMAIVFLLYLALSTFTYANWISAIISPNSAMGYTFAASKSNYVDRNFFTFNSYTGVFPLPFSVLSVLTFIGQPNIPSLALGILVICVMASTLWIKRECESTLALAIWLYLLAIAGFLQLIVTSTSTAYSIFKLTSPASFPLLVFNEPAEIWFFTLIWELLLTYLGLIFLSERLLSTSFKYELWFHSISLKPTQHAKTISKIRGFKDKAQPILSSILVLFLVISLLLNPILTTLPTTLSQSGSKSETYYNNSFYGTFSVPNHIPAFLVNLTNYFQNERATLGPFRALFLPTAPNTQLWQELDPFMIAFPPSNGQLYSYFQHLVIDMNQNSSESPTSILSEMGVRYVVILKVLNESQIGPTIANSNIGPFAVLGNPSEMIKYFANKTGIDSIQTTPDYTLFENIFCQNFFKIGYGAFYQPVKGSIYLGENATFSESLMPPADFSYATVSSVNLISDPNFKGTTSGWTDFGMNTTRSYSIVNGTGSMRITIDNPKQKEIGLTSYNILPDGSGNIIPVDPGQKYDYFGNVSTTDNSSGIIYIGSTAYNETQHAGSYIQTDLSTLTPNSSIEMDGSFVVPEGVFFIQPYIYIGGHLSGVIYFENISLRLLGFAAPAAQSFLNVSKVRTSISSSQLNSLFFNFPGSSYFSIVDNTSLFQKNSMPIFPMTAYKSSGSIAGAQIVFPFSAFDPVFGYSLFNTAGTTMHSLSMISGNLSVDSGRYLVSIELSGRAMSSVTVNNISTEINLTSTGSVYLNIVTQIKSQTLLVNVINYLGVLQIKGIVLFGPDMPNYVIGLLSSQSPEPNELQVHGNSLTHYILNVVDNLSVPRIVMMAQLFAPGWSVHYSENNSLITSSGFLVNGWEIGFLIGQSRNISITILFTPDRLFYVALITQSLSVPIVFASYVYLEVRRGPSRYLIGFMAYLRKFFRRISRRR